MIVDHFRSSRKMSGWSLFLFFWFPGAVIYFLATRLDISQSTSIKVNHTSIPFINKLIYKKKLSKLEASVRNIGSSVKYVQYAELLAHIGDNNEALRAFDRAIEKSNVEIDAYYGAAIVAVRIKNYDMAKKYLEQLLEIDFSAKGGDVSMFYLEVLNELKNRSLFNTHLENHLLKWNHPQAHLFKAILCMENGETDVARGELNSIINDIKSSPDYYASQNRHFEKKAKKLLKSLS